MKFSSVELQKAFDKAKYTLENISQIQDTISNEIKALEKFLQSCSIHESFNFLILSPSEPHAYESDEDGNFSNEKYLVWDASKKRLMYQHNSYCAAIERSAKGCFVISNADTRSTVQYKPLIETSFEIRKDIYDNFLSNFLLGISSKYQIPADDEFDIPF